jgi:hypothetical protein
VQQLVEIGFTEYDIVESGRARETVRARDVSRIEVGRENLGPRVCRCNEIRRKALPAAEVAVDKRLPEASRCSNTFREGREAQDRRRLDSAKVIDIRSVSDVPGTPFSHRYPPGKITGTSARRPQATIADVRFC